jgi:hypothetical protein
MSRRIFKDVEEAIEREVRRITYHDTITRDKTIFQEMFDPFTGELVQRPIEPSLYDSSADTGIIHYPHFFVKLLKTREDRFTNRIIPPYGEICKTQIDTSPRAFEIIAGSSDTTIASPGDTLTTSLFKINSVLPGYLLRILSGNNIGTYIVSSVTPSAFGAHTITLSNDLVVSLPSSVFDVTTGNLIFNSGIDLNTVKIGDVFEDSLAATFPILGVDADNKTIQLATSPAPDISSGGKITRTSPILQNTDPTLVKFIVLDPTRPVKKLNSGGSGLENANSRISRTNPEIPLDAYYLVRIDSKEQDTHVDILNRVWEEFNPPKTGLPVIVRSGLSACMPLSNDITVGGSSTINIGDNSNYDINDPIFIFDDLQPSKNSSGGFQRPFETKIIGKVSTDQLVLQDVVPDTFTQANNTQVVSNAEFRLLMFHFVDHVTKDVEGAQYWVHEFTFWVQIWIDRLGDPKEEGTITDIASTFEDLDGNIIIDCP